MIRVALLLLVLLTLPCAAMAASQSVAWDHDGEPDLAGFRIYCGTASGVYTETITITDPAAREYTITGLTDGVTYYCAATAFDVPVVLASQVGSIPVGAFGNESGYSNEISFVGGGKRGVVGLGGTFTLGTGGTIILQ